MFPLLLRSRCLVPPDRPVCDKCGKPVSNGSIRGEGAHRSREKKAKAERRAGLRFVHFSGGAADFPGEGALSNIDWATTQTSSFSLPSAAFHTVNPQGALCS